MINSKIRNISFARTINVHNTGLQIPTIFEDCRKSLSRDLYLYVQNAIISTRGICTQDFLENLIDVENINFITILISYERQLLDVAETGRDT